MVVLGDDDDGGSEVPQLLDVFEGAHVLGHVDHLVREALGSIALYVMRTACSPACCRR